MADIFVRYLAFPRTVRGVTMPNDDGTFSVYINTCLCEQVQQETFAHELAHIRLNHFYDYEPVVVNEREANTPPTPANPPSGVAPPQPTPQPAAAAPHPTQSATTPPPPLPPARPLPPTRRQTQQQQEQAFRTSETTLRSWEEKHLYPAG